ncbi:RCC1 domain-containing protein [Actinomadura livida]|uniref:Alpha-tubulin suppressor-like RCC1 family protein n=1 Tax=Actinomadura livida TaxID=79909 RepID=A0A7W7I9T8_9ACTN|nr:MULTISPECIES: chromosome condensation regulator RCC1 [Actinomadura]MBB4773184.1 alpha-tubulin suppressor-like RCC1 family protein [Actinomadura catellatispora]
MTPARRAAAALLAVPVLLTAAACGEPASPAPRPIPAPPAAGSAIERTGAVWTSGLNASGQLGRPGAETDPGLAPVTGIGGEGRLDGVHAVAGGGRHSLAIVGAGGEVVAWGANDHGQLGDGTTRDRNVPVPVRAPGGGRLGDVVAIAANNDFSMALRRDGTVVTWGKGSSGQRGIGERTAPRLPTTVRAPDGSGPLTGITAIAADGHTELALRGDGQVLAWGANDYGNLGDGTREDRSLPVPVRGLSGEGHLTGVARIAVAGQHGLALLRDGRVASWGHNDLGQLGDGTRRDRLVPALVKGVRGKGDLGGVSAIAAAEKHNYALREDGTVVAWGNNTAGQLGDGTVELRTEPVPVVGRSKDEKRLRRAAQVFAGEAYGAAILADGTTLTWGAGGSGQLGSGKRAPRSRPGPVAAAAGTAPGKALSAGVGERHLILLVSPQDSVS